MQSTCQEIKNVMVGMSSFLIIKNASNLFGNNNYCVHSEFFISYHLVLASTTHQ